MNVKLQFSKNATSYEEHSIIQRKVIKHLLRKTPDMPRSILDLGCGSGGLYKSIHWQLDNFIAVDFSAEMLSLHPRASGVNCIHGDFNDSVLFKKLARYTLDRIYSASSLQWAGDLKATFDSISKLNTPVSFAIFTANTFRTIFTTADIRPLLRPAEEVSTLADLYFGASYETVRYTLSFDSSLDMFRYVKASGVGGTRNLLGYKEMKRLIRDYPLNYLEFEVLFIIEELGE